MLASPAASECWRSCALPLAMPNAPPLGTGFSSALSPSRRYRGRHPEHGRPMHGRRFPTAERKVSCSCGARGSPPKGQRCAKCPPGSRAQGCSAQDPAGSSWVDGDLNPGTSLRSAQISVGAPARRACTGHQSAFAYARSLIARPFARLANPWRPGPPRVVANTGSWPGPGFPGGRHKLQRILQRVLKPHTDRSGEQAPQTGQPRAGTAAILAFRGRGWKCPACQQCQYTAFRCSCSAGILSRSMLATWQRLLSLTFLAV